MQMTLKAAHKVFLADHPHLDISLSIFVRMRRKNVRLLSSKHRNFCLYVSCLNVHFKLIVLNRVCATTGNKALLIEDEQSLLDVLLCEKLMVHASTIPTVLHHHVNDAETTKRQFRTITPIYRIKP